MKLRYSPTSPYVRKVMVLALETGLSEQLERIPSTVAPTKPNDEVARDNPLVKLPSLTTDDGLVLYDSPVICEYLDSLHDGHKLFPTPGRQRWIALRQQALGDGLLEATILSRYESVRPKEYIWQDWIDAQLRKVGGALTALDSECERGELGDGATTPPTIGQIAVACALGYLEFRYHSEGWLGRHRRLSAWFEEFSRRKSMQLTLPRAPQ